MENEKNRCIFFYFPVAVTNEKKKNEKKFTAESVGILPNCIVKKKICIARLKLYCKRR